MKFGIFFELSVPRPLTRAAEQRVYADALEQTVLADELGFDWVWAVEHHFLEEYSHCSAPELFLTAAAMVTKRIRVGHGAVVCVPPMNHPIRIAERAAVLDILSGGRLELGTARSSTWTELGGFAADPDLTKAWWREYVEVLPRMWTETSFSFSGLSCTIPERNILPKPVQDPHPPIWVTVTTPGTELDAADRGLGCLGVAAVSFDEQERRTAEYHRRIAVCQPVVKKVTPMVTTQNYLYCDESLSRAADIGTDMTATFNMLNSHLLWTREWYPTDAYRSLGNQATRAVKESGAPGEHKPLPEGLAIGDPDRITRELKRWESIGVDGVNFILNAADVIPQQQVLDSLRLFAREVMPAFRATGRGGVMLAGLLDPARLATFAFPEALDVAGATIAQVTWELAGVRGEALLPPALHPTQPTLLSVLAFDGHAQVRLSCRHGARARALVIGASDDVSFDGEVLRAGGAVVRLVQPARELGVGDMQFVASVWPVDMEDRGLRLVQQEVEVEVTSLHRQAAAVEAWPSDWPQPAALVGAGVAMGDAHLPAPRFVSRADVWAHEGSERV